MRGYLGRRLLLAPFVLIGILTLTFLLVNAAPGSPFTPEQASGLDPHAAAKLRELYGAQGSLPARYLRWLSAFATGDFGVSFTYRRPVSHVLRAALPPTLLLAGSALVLSVLAGVTAACVTAVFRSRVLDRVLTLACTALYAAPSFWTGILLLMVFSAWTGWLPPSGLRGVGAGQLGWGPYLADRLRHLALPCIALAAPGAAAVALFLRSELIAALASEYCRAARARGAAGLALTLGHALRNASGPVVSLVGLGLPGLVGGSLVVEVLFAWPGMGRIAYEAILARDTPMVAGAVVVAAAVTLAASLVTDMLYLAADPRVSLVASPVRIEGAA